MKRISYDVSLVLQETSECLQASSTSLLNYYDIKKDIQEVKKEVPVYVNSKNEPQGTSIGHIGYYLIKQGLKAVLKVVDIEIFDQSWKDLSSKETVEKLNQRKRFIKHARYDYEALELLFDGYTTFLEMGGKIEFPIIDEEYLVTQLKNGPFIAIVSFNFLHSDSKYKYDDLSKSFIKDDIQGIPTTHAIVVCGYQNHEFQIMDPDKERGGKKTISSSLLIGSIYLAETDCDALLLCVEIT